MCHPAHVGGGGHETRVPPLHTCREAIGAIARNGRSAPPDVCLRATAARLCRRGLARLLANLMRRGCLTTARPRGRPHPGANVNTAGGSGSRSACVRVLHLRSRDAPRTRLLLLKRARDRWESRASNGDVMCCATVIHARAAGGGVVATRVEHGASSLVAARALASGSACPGQSRGSRVAAGTAVQHSSG